MHYPRRNPSSRKSGFSSRETKTVKLKNRKKETPIRKAPLQTTELWMISRWTMLMNLKKTETRGSRMVMFDMRRFLSFGGGDSHASASGSGSGGGSGNFLFDIIRVSP
jgi:uncharacterized membrane protein YgcG